MNLKLKYNLLKWLPLVWNFFILYTGGLICNSIYPYSGFIFCAGYLINYANQGVFYVCNKKMDIMLDESLIKEINKAQAHIKNLNDSKNENINLH